MGRKEGAVVPLLQELKPHLIRCGLGRGLLPYQVASSSIQPFAHSRHGPKIGWGGYAVFSGGSCVPIEHKVAWADAYLHTKWHHRASSRLATTDLAENWGLCPFRGGELSPHLTQCCVDRGPHLYQLTKWHLDPSSRLTTIDMGRKLGAPPLFG